MGRKVFAIVGDMFFASKIRATAEALGVDVFFPRTKQALFEKLANTKPDLIVMDLHNQQLDPTELARELKATDNLQDVVLLGFFSHVETELQRNALDAGFDQVVPRSVFSRDLSKILNG